MELVFVSYGGEGGDDGLGLLEDASCFCVLVEVGVGDGA